jgi:uncharacterized LabA/DUF88 family protein
MNAYLIVDVDDLLEHFRRHNLSVDLQELAVGLRGGAALAAGLASQDKLKAIAAANWDAQPPTGFAADALNAHDVFRTAGYEIFSITDHDQLTDGLVTQYFASDPDPVDELILVTTSAALLDLLSRVKTRRTARIRLWGTKDIIKGTPYEEDEVIFQPVETLLGIKQTKNVAVYIDFENIAISLKEQGFTVNLDLLIQAFVRQAQAHGQPVRMSAYAPWGMRGSLPPLIDSAGREVTDEATSRLMLANIEPVITLPGKNSADMKIAQNAITDSGHTDAADVYIVASGDRDFNDMINALRARNKTVILWAVRGSTSRQLEKNTNVSIEYVEDFANLENVQTQFAALAPQDEPPVLGFTPSQWSSVIVQFDRLAQAHKTDGVTLSRLVDQLIEVGAVINRQRGEDLVAQAISMGILKQGRGERLLLDDLNATVEKTRLVRDRIVMRVMNTLNVRDWEYVNYGFLLKGLAMDREMDRPGLNYSDQWRSDWIDCLVREHVLLRELVPHRHNPEDLVPVIKLRPEYPVAAPVPVVERPRPETWEGVLLSALDESEADTGAMVRRIIISVEQFTSFRGYSWCPLGSLHRRLRNYDQGMSFQRAVEYLIENHAAQVEEYANPQSEFKTKGISLDASTPVVASILSDRNTFIQVLLALYERGMIITEDNLAAALEDPRWNIPLWISIMETENVLNAVPGRMGQYSLFRTHHTVALVADRQRVGPPPSPAEEA